MLPGRTFQPLDIVRIVLRRRWLILIPFALGLMAVPVLAKRVPEVYRSETLIMVVPQRVPDSYVKSTVTATIADRLPSISDQILSRSRLERIINEFDLYRSQLAQAPMEDVIRQMRADIGSPEIQPGAQAFRISYRNRDPQIAQKVTARLASLFIDENSRDREQLAESTNVFLESQLEDAKQRLIQHEQKLVAYRQMHSGELPSQLEGNLRAIQTAQMQLQSLNETMNRAQERRLLVERQLVDAQTLPTASIQLVVPGGAEARPAMTAAQQLEAANSQLEALRLRYTAEHPEVRRLERQVSELKERAAEEARRPAPLPSVQSPVVDPVRLKRMRDLQAELDVIDHQLAAMHTEESRAKTAIAEYQQKVEAVPKRESELVELTRDYDILKKTYDSLLTKREDSKLAANLERRQIGEQFRMLDPASLPARPANQLQRTAFSVAGAALGLLLGLAGVTLLEMLDSSFASEQDVARILDLPVLALVPVMASARESIRQRRRRLAIDVAGVCVLMMSAAVLVAWGLRKF